MPVVKVEGRVFAKVLEYLNFHTAAENKAVDGVGLTEVRTPHSLLSFNGNICSRRRSI